MAKLSEKERSIWGDGTELVLALLAKEADVNAEGGEYENPLDEKLACLIEVLLANGANGNAQGWECGITLNVASSQGHEAVVIAVKSGIEAFKSVLKHGLLGWSMLLDGFENYHRLSAQCWFRGFRGKNSVHRTAFWQCWDQFWAVSLAKSNFGTPA
jgi:hypothetical protein